MVATVRPLTGAVDVASSSLGVGPGSTGGRRWTGEMRDFMRSSRRAKWRGMVLICVMKGLPFHWLLAYNTERALRMALSMSAALFELAGTMLPRAPGRDASEGFRRDRRKPASSSILHR